MASSGEATRPRLTRDDVLDARQVADLLHLPISTALDLARRGILPGHKLGRRWIFLRDEIETGVRDAPNRTAISHPQPPGQIRPRRSHHYLERYPEAVPRRAVAVQQQLFG
jgi:hypothetical protein